MKQSLTKNFYPLAVATLASAIFFAGAALAQADTYATDFESYVLGNINGQDGWSKTGSYDVEIDSALSTPTFGAQSLRISSGIASGSFGDQTFTRSLANEAGETSAEGGGMSGGTRQNYFEAEWDVASAVPGAEQPGLSVVASPDRGDGARMSWVQMLDTPTGLAINFNDFQTGAGFVQTSVVSGLDRAVPHTIKITMEFVDGPANDVVKVYVDGVLEHTGTSWEDYFRDSENNPTRTVDSILFRTNVAAPATLDEGFLIDNLSLKSETPVVDPDTDDDGVLNADDKCEGTVADAFPKYGDKTAKNRWMLNADEVWKTNAKPGTMGGFQPTIVSTYGCSGLQILDAMSEATGLDFGGEYKFGITKGTLETWMTGKYYVGPVLRETVIVAADDVDGVASATTLKAGADYTLVARGTANAGDGIDFDADYSFRAASSLNWTDAVSTYEYYGDTLLDLMVNGGFVTWGYGTFAADHEYAYEMTGTGVPVTLGVYDVYFPGNTGSLSVDIIEDTWVDLW